jgi:hypothetical protein
MSLPLIVREDLFQELEDNGVSSDYSGIAVYEDRREVIPMLMLDYIKATWGVRGMLVKFLAEGGYPEEVPEALKKGIVPGQVLTIETLEIGQSMSHYTFKSIDGRFNTVMFEVLPSVEFSETN